MTQLGYGRDQLVYQGLINRGLTPAAAAGVAGNAGAESSFGANMFNPAGGGQGARGMFQWRGPRLDNFRAFADQSGGSMDDPNTNMDFLIYEMANHPEHAGITLDELNAIDDPVKAGTVFRDRFERPGGHGYEATTRHAADLYNKYSGLEPVTNPTMDQKLSFGKAAKPTALIGFADDADKRSRDIQSLASKLGDSMSEDSRFMLEAMMPGNYAAALEGRSKGGGTQSSASAPANGQLSFGAVGGSEAAPTYSTSGTAAPAAANPEEASDKKPGLMSRIFAPSQGEENLPFYRRSSFTDALTGLGVGLGQMSHGQPVNIVPAVAALREGRQRRVDSARAADQQAFSNALAVQNAGTQAANAELAQRRFDLDTAKFEQDVAEFNATSALGTVPVTPADLAPLVAANPSLAPVAKAALSGDKDAAKQLWEYSAAPLATQKPPMSDDAKAVAKLAAEGMPESTWRPMMAQLTPDEVSFVDAVRPQNIDNIDEAAAVADLQERAAAGDQNAKQTLDAYNRTQAFRGGINLEQRLGAADVERYDNIIDAAYEDADTANKMAPLIAETITSTVAVNNAGGETGTATPLIRYGASLLNSVGWTAAADELQKQFGIAPDVLEQMSMDGRSFMYGLKNQIGMSGANFSDADARMLSQISPSDVNSSRGRALLLSRMQANNTIDNAKAEYVTDPLTTPENVRQRQRYANLTLGKYTRELSKAAEYATLVRLSGTESGDNMEPEARTYNLLRTLGAAESEEQLADMLHKAGLTRTHYNALLDNQYARIPISVASMYAKHAPYLTKVKDPATGHYYLKQNDGSWKDLGQ